MNPMPDRRPPDQESLPITGPSDLLEMLLPGSHSFWRLPLELDEASNGRPPVGRRWGQFIPSHWGQLRASFLTIRHELATPGNRPGSKANSSTSGRWTNERQTRRADGSIGSRSAIAWPV